MDGPSAATSDGVEVAKTVKALKCRTHWMKEKYSLEKRRIFAIQLNNNVKHDCQPSWLFEVLIMMGWFSEENHTIITLPGGFTFSG